MDGNDDVRCNLPELADMKFAGAASPEDLFSIFEGLDAELARFDHRHRHQDSIEANAGALGRKQSNSIVSHESETELEIEPPLTLPMRSGHKRPRVSGGTAGGVLLDDDNNVNINNQLQDGQPRVSHIAVERNRRKLMNEHLALLRSFMPSFYVKRGDQASIIGGVIDYINELQQVLQSLEAKKQRKVYTESVLSPRPILSPRLSPRPNPLLSPRLNLPISPRLNLPISPRTPQPPSPYKPRLSGSYTNSPTTTSSSSSSINDSVANELAANSKSAVADVEVKLSGANLVLKTVSGRIPGQVSKIVYALEELSLEILHVNISSIDEAMVNYSFTIKIGIECQLSAEELAHHIQQTFHSSTTPPISSLLTN